MATSISLATYTIRLKDRETGEFLDLDEFLGHDFLEVFRDYLEDRGGSASDDEERQKLLRASDHELDGRTVSGWLEGGDYGFEADLFDVSGGQVSYRRKTSDAELLPFYFLLSVPEESTRAVLILERFRQFGIRSTLWQDFNIYFEPYLQDVILQLNPIVPSGLIEKVRGGKHIKSIRFIHFGLPADVANAPRREERCRRRGGCARTRNTCRSGRSSSPAEKGDRRTEGGERSVPSG